MGRIRRLLLSAHSQLSVIALEGPARPQPGRDAGGTDQACHQSATAIFPSPGPVVRRPRSAVRPDTPGPPQRVRPSSHCATRGLRRSRQARERVPVGGGSSVRHHGRQSPTATSGLDQRACTRWTPARLSTFGVALPGRCRSLPGNWTTPRDGSRDSCGGRPRPTRSAARLAVRTNARSPPAGHAPDSRDQMGTGAVRESRERLRAGWRDLDRRDPWCNRLGHRVPDRVRQASEAEAGRRRTSAGSSPGGGGVLGAGGADDRKGMRTSRAPATGKGNGHAGVCLRRCTGGGTSTASGAEERIPAAADACGPTFRYASGGTDSPRRRALPGIRRV